jgi:hypothetical protein
MAIETAQTTNKTQDRLPFIAENNTVYWIPPGIIGSSRSSRFNFTAIPMHSTNRKDSLHFPMKPSELWAFNPKLCDRSKWNIAQYAYFVHAAWIVINKCSKNVWLCCVRNFGCLTDLKYKLALSLLRIFFWYEWQTKRVNRLTRTIAQTVLSLQVVLRSYYF